MNVYVVGSDGHVFGRVEVVSGEVILSRAIETDIWGRQSKKLATDIAHMEALKSRQITWRAGGGFLDDGTPVTDEILLAWGWRRDEQRWVTP